MSSVICFIDDTKEMVATYIIAYRVGERQDGHSDEGNIIYQIYENKNVPILYGVKLNFGFSIIFFVI